jgi:hypothetical protein
MKYSPDHLSCRHVLVHRAGRCVRVFPEGRVGQVVHTPANQQRTNFQSRVLSINCLGTHIFWHVRLIVQPIILPPPHFSILLGDETMKFRRN